MATPNKSFSQPVFVRGAVGGVVAFLVGYLVTYVWKAATVAEAFRAINVVASFLGGNTIPTWKGIGWVFYNAQFVTTRIPFPGGARMVNFIAQSDDPLLGLLYGLVPLLLVLAGVLVVRQAGGPAPTQAAIQGAMVVIGYLPMVVLGAVLFGHSFGTDATIGPDLITAMLVAGIGYPLVWGGIGGFLATIGS